MANTKVIIKNFFPFIKLSKCEVLGIGAASDITICSIAGVINPSIEEIGILPKTGISDYHAIISELYNAYIVNGIIPIEDLTVTFGLLAFTMTQKDVSQMAAIGAWFVENNKVLTFSHTAL
jgi:hypothetical protein